jgi:hypothetical protein
MKDKEPGSLAAFIAQCLRNADAEGGSPQEMHRVTVRLSEGQFVALTNIAARFNMTRTAAAEGLVTAAILDAHATLTAEWKDRVEA